MLRNLKNYKIYFGLFVLLGYSADTASSLIIAIIKGIAFSAECRDHIINLMEFLSDFLGPVSYYRRNRFIKNARFSLTGACYPTSGWTYLI